MSTEMNYYEVLQVSKNASGQEIKDAYRRLTLKWHPDRSPKNKAAAAKKFQEISQAYEILSDEGRRGKYDAGKLGDYEFHSPAEVYKNFRVAAATANLALLANEGKTNNDVPLKKEEPKIPEPKKEEPKTPEPKPKRVPSAKKKVTPAAGTSAAPQTEKDVCVGIINDFFSFSEDDGQQQCRMRPNLIPGSSNYYPRAASIETQVIDGKKNVIKKVVENGQEITTVHVDGVLKSRVVRDLASSCPFRG